MTLKPIIFKSKTIKPVHLILIVMVVVALGFLWFKLKQDSPNYAAENSVKTANTVNVEPKAALTVDLVQLSQTIMNQNLAANGNIAPWQEAIIGSEANGLQLNSVMVNIGDVVKHGQLLASFSASTIEADIAQANANLAEAKASAAEAAGNATRARSIADTGALSTQTIDQLLALEATSRAKVAASEATLQLQIIRLKQTKVFAPDDGVISARTATVGAVIATSQELFKLIRQARLEWRAELTSADIGKITKGMTANLTLPDGNIISGKVRTSSPVVDSQTRNAIVFVDLADNLKAKAGMFARGNFLLGTQKVITLPASAIVMKDGFNYVMQVDAQNRIRQIKVNTGSSDGANIEVNLSDTSQNFVVSGGAFLADGDLVNIAPSNTNATKPIIKNASRRIN